jgi:hypothetical protein
VLQHLLCQERLPNQQRVCVPFLCTIEQFIRKGPRSRRLCSGHRLQLPRVCCRSNGVKKGDVIDEALHRLQLGFLDASAACSMQKTVQLTSDRQPIRALLH